MFGIHRSTVYGHLDREKTLPRQPKKTTVSKPSQLPTGYLFPGVSARTSGLVAPLVDRGVTVSAALSTGELLICPVVSKAESARLVRLQRRLAKAQRGSNRRAKLQARIAFEALQVTAMTASAKGTLEVPGAGVRQKAGSNRSILRHAWGGLLARTMDKAPGRVVVVPAAYTSQRCSRCGHTAGENRESQAVFACRACGYTAHADVNAGINIDTAAGHAVVLRGEGTQATGPVNREPQPDLLPLW